MSGDWRDTYRQVVPLGARKLVHSGRVRTQAIRQILRPNSPTAELFGGATYSEDGFATTHFVGFLEEPRFRTAYEAALAGIPEDRVENFSSIRWRAHICCWAAQRAMHLEGDFVECGVWWGMLSKIVCEYVDFGSLPKTFYLLDSWGLVDGSHPNPDYWEDIFSEVESRFAPYSNVKLVRGLVPAALRQVPSDKIAYLAIDMNGALPELSALEYFYDKLVPGGVVYLDDYGWEYPELRKVVDGFLADKPESLLNFPSGNAIFIKT